MEVEDFKTKIEDHADLDYMVVEGDIVVYNNRFDTETRFTTEKIEELDFKTLKTHTHQGRNIRQMTRVTGYFSNVDGWNKGKQGELKERGRVSI